jgi:hypothetical protein
MPIADKIDNGDERGKMDENAEAVNARKGCHAKGAELFS